MAQSSVEQPCREGGIWVGEGVREGQDPRVQRPWGGGMPTVHPNTKGQRPGGELSRGWGRDSWEQGEDGRRMAQGRGGVTT